MVTFMFPGQGSQSIGMGKELYDSFDVAKKVFQEVDDALNQKLSTLMFEGDAAELGLTRNTQPALMAVSIAAFRVLQKEVNFPFFQHNFTGHSLGEYAAHAAIGTFSLADTAKLLRIRGEAMQNAVPVGIGAMAALIGSGGKAKAAELAASVSTSTCFCSVANDNSQEQVVISGHAEAIDKAIEAANNFDFKRAVRLQVSAPFHTKLMQPAADAMKQALADVKASESINANLFANVTAELVATPESAKDLLVRQVTGEVRWCETMQNLIAKGSTKFVEIGAGSVLCGLMRKIDSTIPTFNVGSPKDIDSFINEVVNVSN